MTARFDHDSACYNRSYSRVTRVYYYEWHGDAYFDTGLVTPNSATTRSTYDLCRTYTNPSNSAP